MFILEGRKNKKTNRPNFLKGRHSHIPSQTNRKNTFVVNDSVTLEEFVLWK